MWGWRLPLSDLLAAASAFLRWSVLLRLRLHVHRHSDAWNTRCHSCVMSFCDVLTFRNHVGLTNTYPDRCVGPQHDVDDLTESACIVVVSMQLKVNAGHRKKDAKWTICGPVVNLFTIRFITEQDRREYDCSDRNSSSTGSSSNISSSSNGRSTLKSVQCRRTRKLSGPYMPVCA
jgi:hypothetical protein